MAKFLIRWKQKINSVIRGSYKRIKCLVDLSLRIILNLKIRDILKQKNVLHLIKKNNDR